VFGGVRVDFLLDSDDLQNLSMTSSRWPVRNVRKDVRWCSVDVRINFLLDSWWPFDLEFEGCSEGCSELFGCSDRLPIRLRWPWTNFDDLDFGSPKYIQKL